LDFGEKRIWEELVRIARATVPSLAIIVLRSKHRGDLIF